MKYMQYGGMQNHPLMRLTLYFTLFFLFGFWVTNFAMYFAKMNLTPQSVIDYYLGSEADFRLPRTYQAMLEVAHMHLPMMAMVILVLTHLLVFSNFQHRTKVAFIVVAFLSALLHEAAGWLVRFVHPMFAWLKVTMFVTMQGTLAFLMVTLLLFLVQDKNRKGNPINIPMEKK
ncbi:MAG: hypothetical protein ONB46_17230 [candidate division KSB1 bacterium]|nr:hypothetical protein [candidate division KSB1 bacterium]MDZ7367421.1 hypothetical protein [candidate division KSB1 bacterium]MDZ7405474.1 hypothetical protein [candidate division KSB1 bacterium]